MRGRDENAGLKKIFLFLCMIMFSFQPAAFTDDTEITISGYIKNFFIRSDSDTDSTSEALSRLRLRLDIGISDSSSLELAYELFPRLRSQETRFFGELLPTEALQSYRAFDLEERIYPGDEESGSDFSLFQNLDRAYVSVATPDLDIAFGRQPVSFGSAHAINPTDVIVPFTYNTIAKEELIGVDAVRVKKPLSDLGEIEAGLVFGEDFEPDKSAAFLRLKTYQLRTDITFLAMVFRKNLLLGIDLVRSIVGANAWIEAAHTMANMTSHYEPEENYFRLSLGSDYSFTSDLYAYIEYHYSGAGSGEPEDYLIKLRETAFTDGAVYLLGRHYLASGFTYQVTPLLTFSGQALINLGDGSALFAPFVEYSIAQDIFIVLGAYIGIGEGLSDTGRPESEFGLYPDTWFTALNVYF
jgi:hypothetical protein